MANSITDIELSDHINGCPSFVPIDYCRYSTYDLVANYILSPAFNELQLHKSRNSRNYMFNEMKKVSSSVLNSVKNNEKLTKNLKKFFHKFNDTSKELCNYYYRLFQSDYLYNQYKVLSFSFLYDTKILNNLDTNITGKIDLIIKSGGGVTLINYFFNDNHFPFVYDYCTNITRLQIGARCFELLTGMKPRALILLYFKKGRLLKKYFKYNEQPYELYAKIAKDSIDPVKYRYSYLCSYCKKIYCNPVYPRKESIEKIKTLEIANYIRDIEGRNDTEL